MLGSPQESSLSEHTTYKDQVNGQYHSAQIGMKRGLLNMSRDSEQRETDEFEEAERRMLAEEAKVGLDLMFLPLVSLCVFICVQNSLLDSNLNRTLCYTTSTNGRNPGSNVQEYCCVLKECFKLS